MISNIPPDDVIRIYFDTAKPVDPEIGLEFATSILAELRALGFDQVRIERIGQGSFVVEYLTIAAASITIAGAFYSIYEKMKAGEDKVGEQTFIIMQRYEAKRCEVQVGVEVQYIYIEDVTAAQSAKSKTTDSEHLEAAAKVAESDVIPKLKVDSGEPPVSLKGVGLGPDRAGAEEVGDTASETDADMRRTISADQSYFISWHKGEAFAIKRSFTVDGLSTQLMRGNYLSIHPDFGKEDDTNNLGNNFTEIEGVFDIVEGTDGNDFARIIDVDGHANRLTHIDQFIPIAEGTRVRASGYWVYPGDDELPAMSSEDGAEMVFAITALRMVKADKTDEASGDDAKPPVPAKGKALRPDDAHEDQSDREARRALSSHGKKDAVYPSAWEVIDEGPGFRLGRVKNEVSFNEQWERNETIVVEHEKYEDLPNGGEGAAAKITGYFFKRGQNKQGPFATLRNANAEYRLTDLEEAFPFEDFTPVVAEGYFVNGRRKHIAEFATTNVRIATQEEIQAASGQGDLDVGYSWNSGENLEIGRSLKAGDLAYMLKKNDHVTYLHELKVADGKKSSDYAATEIGTIRALRDHYSGERYPVLRTGEKSIHLTDMEERLKNLDGFEVEMIGYWLKGRQTITNLPEKNRVPHDCFAPVEISILKRP